nr:CP [Pineapple mealybug wilt-associated virus 6]
MASSGSTAELRTGGIYELVKENNKRVRVTPDIARKFVLTSELRFIKEGTTDVELNQLPSIPAQYLYNSHQEAMASSASTSGVNKEKDATDVGVDPATVRLAPSRPRLVKDPMVFLDSLSKDIIIDFNDIKEKPKVINEPGLVSKDIALKINAALKELCGRIMGNTEPTTVSVFILHVLQLAITFSTSTSAEFKEYDYIDTPDGKRIFVEQVYSTIRSACTSTGYENPVRQYLQYYTATVVTCLLNGKLTPNEKVMAQHGVPPKFFPYTPDIVRPNYNMFNNNAILANNLAKQHAFKNKNVATDMTLHNVYQLQSKA